MKKSGHYLIIPVMALIIFAVCVFLVKIYGNGPMGWDEAARFVNAARLHHAVSSGSYRDMYEILDQNFLYSAFFILESALIFFVTPLSPVVIRILSLFHLTACGLLVFILGYNSAPHKDRNWAFIGMIAFITAPVVLDIGVLGRVDSLGALLTLLFVYSIRNWRMKRGTSILLAGLALLGTALTKYNFFIYILICWIIDLGIRFIRKEGNRHLQELIFVLVPSISVLSTGFSFGFQKKIQNLGMFFLNRDPGLPVREKLLFYPETLLTGFSTIPVLSIVWFGILFYSIGKLRDMHFRLSSLLIWIPLLLLTFHPYALQRQFMMSFAVITTFLPAFLGWVNMKLRNRRLTYAIISSAVILATLPGTANLFKPHRLISNKPLEPVLDTIRGDCTGGKRILVLGAIDELSPNLIWSRLALRDNRWYPGVYVMIFEDYHNPGEREVRLLPTLNLPFYRDALNNVLINMTPPIDTVIAIKILDNSPFASTDFYQWTRWKQVYVHLMEQQPYFPYGHRYEFPQQGIILTIYRSHFDSLP